MRREDCEYAGGKLGRADQRRQERVGHLLPRRRVKPLWACFTLHPILTLAIRNPLRARRNEVPSDNDCLGPSERHSWRILVMKLDIRVYKGLFEVWGVVRDRWLASGARLPRRNFTHASSPTTHTPRSSWFVWGLSAMGIRSYCRKADSTSLRSSYLPRSSMTAP